MKNKYKCFVEIDGQQLYC